MEEKEDSSLIHCHVMVLI